MGVWRRYGPDHLYRVNEYGEPLMPDAEARWVAEARVVRRVRCFGCDTYVTLLPLEFARSRWDDEATYCDECDDG